MRANNVTLYTLESLLDFSEFALNVALTALVLVHVSSRQL